MSQYWFSTLVTEMDDTHLLNSRDKALDRIPDMQSDLDDCEEWQTVKRENLEERLDEWESSLIAVQDEIKKRGLEDA